MAEAVDLTYRDGVWQVSRRGRGVVAEGRGFNVSGLDVESIGDGELVVRNKTGPVHVEEKGSRVYLTKRDTTGWF